MNWPHSKEVAYPSGTTVGMARAAEDSRLSASLAHPACLKTSHVNALLRLLPWLSR